MGTIEVRGASIKFAWLPVSDKKSDRLARPPIVFLLHGFGSVADWKAYPEKVVKATGLPGLVYSRRGCGRSSPLLSARDTTYLHEEAQRWLPAILDTVGIGQCHLYGHSDGATIALLFAAAFPNRAASAVVEAPHVFAGVAALTKRYEEDVSVREKLARYHRDAEHAFNAWSRAWLLPQFRDWSISDELERLKLPLLVIQGSADPFGSTEHARRIRECTGQLTSMLELSKCGHNPHIEAECDTLRAVVDFFSARDRVAQRNSPRVRVC